MKRRLTKKTLEGVIRATSIVQQMADTGAELYGITKSELELVEQAARWARSLYTERYTGGYSGPDNPQG